MTALLGVFAAAAALAALPALDREHLPQLPPAAAQHPPLRALLDVGLASAPLRCRRVDRAVELVGLDLALHVLA
jgi:hypothetical protein